MKIKAKLKAVLIISIIGFLALSKPVTAIEERFSQSATANVVVGSPRTDCPDIWPVPGDFVTQGPLGTAGHAGLAEGGELAIDISAAPGTPISTTFTGTVVLADAEGGSGYGIQVRIQGTCNGTPFTAVFAHMQAIAAGIEDGVTVAKGQLIGFVGWTGHVIPAGPAGAHLHYSFIGLSPMNTPYIPKTIEPTCSNSVYPGCGTVP